MKTEKNYSSLLKKTIFTIILTGSLNALIGQSGSTWGISACTQVSANGYGGEYNPALFLKKGRMTWFAGPTIQNQKFNVSGGKVAFNYALNDMQEDETNLELYAFANAAYHWNALMGRTTLRNEEMSNSEYQGPCFKEITFKSVEVFAGVGLNYRIFKNISWTNAIGLGMNHSFDFPCHLYYQANNVGLMGKTGIVINLKTN